MLYDSIASVLIIIAGLLFVVSATALWHAPDALTRANLLGPATSVALPLIVIATLLHDIGAGSFEINHLVRAIVAIVALWVVLAVASFVMGRALHEVSQES
ncbi:Na+/H+ antiporter subunit G [Corynebacterium diphtheriae]|uniref:Membrane protein n=2 Tax=Corynebacterium diphtheriae TaxID=1717 RepID=Q6NJV5_CORDI|nr:Na+/H+ antiporter subunit G [Corynebacterium diphtheriae]OWN41057.1 Na+/H+ antiporter subunit G [Corynebacterium belfantii]AEX71244.1 putative monovalent cation/H+ antiporter subunit G [Corynebacterium diphtheriae CDCE 8392]AEX77952.1 putative monovalent cation/H+ antiporter subunit G [Corynebacterium diphtheriae HC03]AEX80197.1 putative monovalent cation/H+ antiporter subunit G [Corynebacterium diphtheriae HC04]AEX82457.1 putative monovalent cation/H+ antiporter subunit G [Corynebacterium 